MGTVEAAMLAFMSGTLESLFEYQEKEGWCTYYATNLEAGQNNDNDA